VDKQNRNPQLSIFDTPLEKFINMNHQLCVFANRIGWEFIENNLEQEPE